MTSPLRLLLGTSSLALLLAAPQAHAASLTTTFAGGNGQSGNMFRMSATNDLTITSLDIHPSSSGSCSWEVYTTSSTLDSTVAGSSSYWTLRASGTQSMTSGTANTISFSTPVTMAAGTSLYWYVTMSSGCGFSYTNGSSFGAAYTSNADLTIYEGYGIQYAFSSQFSPRVWNGTVTYTACTSNVYYFDSDNDGYGDAARSTTGCSAPAGYVSDGSDCDDGDSSVYPGAPEYCNTVDDDCDGTIDEDTAVDATTWYEDADADSFGTPSVTDVACYQPSGFVADNTDCDDAEASTYPGADETCDGTDNNCDGTTDEDAAIDVRTWYRDADADSYGNPSVTDIDCAQPAGYVADNTDCDDAAATTNPGAAEYCNAVDDNCDGTIDESSAVDATTWYRDADADSYGDPTITDVECSQPAGYVADNTDCDDTVASTYPGADEYCNGRDDDCDGTTDEDAALDVLTWYRDADADSYGNASVTDIDCAQPAGYVADNTDCDDTVASTYPGADETCNSVDDDCDGTTDEDSAIDATTWYEDADGDSFGNTAVTDVECSQPSGYVADNTDCDDTVASTYPGADEYCDAVDNNCNGEVDEDTAVDVVTWYADADGDTFGDPAVSDLDCDQPSGMVEDNTDCDDTAATSYPGADEYCDGTDNNCDGEVDEDTAVDVVTWYEDGDSDGHGDPAVADLDCDQPSGFVSLGDDCDDTDPSIYPGAEEIEYDGIDQDCDTEDLCDVDEDDHNALECGGDDCDDDDPTVYTGATETWYDDIDQDCDGLSDYDADYDGHDSETWGGDDCDDADADVYPGAPDEPYDGVIYDCDESDEYDADSDGYLSADHGGDDCDDANSSVNVDAVEVWYDGVDQDCDGTDDDQDLDGYSVDEDCDDTDPDVYPGGGGFDDDCNELEESTSGLSADSGLGGDALSGASGGGGAACGGTKSSAGLGFLALLTLGLGGLRRRRD